MRTTVRNAPTTIRMRLFGNFIIKQNIRTIDIIAKKFLIFFQKYVLNNQAYKNLRIIKKSPHKMRAFNKWCLQESNQGHMDFQSIALPTELRHQL